MVVLDGHFEGEERPKRAVGPQPEERSRKGESGAHDESRGHPEKRFDMVRVGGAEQWRSPGDYVVGQNERGLAE